MLKHLTAWWEDLTDKLEVKNLENVLTNGRQSMRKINKQAPYNNATKNS